MGNNKPKIAYYIVFYKDTGETIIQGIYSTKAKAKAVYSYYFKQNNYKCEWKMSLGVAKLDGISCIDYDDFIKNYPDMENEVTKVDFASLEIK